MKQFYIIVTLLLWVRMVAAQDSCPSIAETALNAVDAFCADVGRNQACYGNVRIESVPQPTAANFAFEQTGDIVDVADIQSLRLAPMDTDSGQWGVALLRLQANIPDTLPGQNVSVLLFGDVEVKSAVTEENADQYAPMQAFVMTTGIGDAACVEAPQSGVLVQTPKGVGQIYFNVNGVDVAMGSTVFLQAQRSQQMRVSTLEGSASLRIGERIYTAVAGSRLSFDVDEDLIPLEETISLESLDLEDIEVLPYALLEYEFDLPEPLDEALLAEWLAYFNEGYLLCDEEPFPPCDALPEDFILNWCVLGCPQDIFDLYQDDIDEFFDDSGFDDDSGGASGSFDDSGSDDSGGFDDNGGASGSFDDSGGDDDGGDDDDGDDDDDD